MPGMLWVTLLTLGISMTALAQDGESSGSSQQESVEIMKSFAEQTEERAAGEELTRKERYTIMFLLGVPLLILLITTVALGLAMALYNKRVFVWHMITAGLSLTLAIIHTVVGLVWFYPF